MSDINANMSVKGGPTIAVKKVSQAKVDLKARTGKVGEVGDVVKAAMDRISSPPDPRELARQSMVMSSKLPQGKAPKLAYQKPDGE